MKKNLFILIFLASLLASCTDLYWPEIDKYEGALVVDGMLTNEPGPYTIRLQTTTPLRSPAIKPLSDAEVMITDELGNIEFFHETESGVYTNNSPDFQGKIGHSYQLTVAIADNKTYISSWEKLPPPIEINSVYAEIEYHEVAEDETYPGYQFYIDTDEASTDTTYLLWRAESTYKYKSTFQIFFYYDGNLHPFSDFDSLQTCYLTNPVPMLNTYKLVNSDENKVNRFPLFFVSTEDKKLSIRYSALVKQLSLTETTYNYWSSLQKQEDIQGSLYTNQPYQIRGNMKNLESDDEPVMGCFLVAGISQKRIFVDRPFGVQFFYGECELRQSNFEDYGRRRFLERQYYPYYVTQTDAGARAIPDEYCADCRDSGGKIEKPEFWIDE
ncbi:MAG TPA: DUF4249 domain-containing protein [Bacteroidales bacterium]